MLAFAALARRQTTSRSPILAPTLLRKRPFVAGLSVAVLLFAGTAPAHALITGALIVAATCVLCAVVVLALPSTERNTAA